MMTHLVGGGGGGGGGGGVSVGSEVHTTYYSFSYTTFPVKPIFVYLEACSLLHFANVENFVKYTFIYIMQLYFSTLLQIIFCPISCKLKSCSTV